jgi:tRNA (Thr-GGU) A37 N-methylase
VQASVPILSIDSTRLCVRNLEALDGTPILDVESVLDVGTSARTTRVVNDDAMVRLGATQLAM